MKISVATSVFVNYSIEETVQEIIEAGFEGIDFWCGRPHFYRNDHPASIYQSLKEKLNTHSVTAVSAMPAFFRYPYSLSSPLAPIREDSIQYMFDCIHNATKIGAEFVLVVPTNLIHGQTVDDARGFFVESLGKVVREAEKESTKLGIEIVYPILSSYMKSTQDALQVIHELGNPDCLGVVLDSGHLNLSGENPESAINNLGNRLFHVHVNDNNSKVQSNDIPGEGTFDFLHFLRLLHKYNYDGFVMTELGWHYSFDPVTPVRRALERMRAFIQEAA
jgi:protein FrlC